MVRRASLVVLALVGCSSSSSTSTPVNGDTCGFVKSADNCWRSLRAKIELCLGEVEGEKGTLAVDGKSCAYPSGRVVTFAIALDPSKKYQDKDFTVTVAGKTCVHWVEIKGSDTFAITGPNGEVLKEIGDLESGGGTLVCPDGSQFAIDGATLLRSCLSEAIAGGIPGSSTSFDGTQSSLTMLGSTEPAFNCKK